MNMESEKEKNEPDEAEEVIGNVPCLCSQRWIMGYMGLLLGVCMYLLRVDFSMAMVCMVAAPESEVHNETNTTIWLYTHESSNLSDLVLGNRTADATEDCLENLQDTVEDKRNAEFRWSKSFQSLLLSVYYIGCFVSQVPGGWLANRYGGKRIVTISMLIPSLCTLLTPLLLRTNPYLVLPVRIIMGLCSGVVLPAWYDLIGIWVPPFERSRFTAFCWIGQVFGTILAYSTSGLLCAHTPDNGWPSIFYVHGSVTLLFVLCWQFLVADRPTKHRRISQAELSYIAKFVSAKTKEESRYIPWRAILTARPVLAVYICHICDAWTFFTLLICLPMFLKDVLKLDVQKNGLYSSIPYVAFAISLFVCGNIADFLIAKRVFTTTAVRRIFQIFGFFGAGVSICLNGFVTCSQHSLAILYVCLCNIFVGVGEGGGYTPNLVDIAPKYCGIIFAVSNMMAQIPGFVAPAVVGSLTPNGTGAEWRNVFYICAGLDLVGALVFGSLSSGEVQPWSRTNNLELVIKVNGTNTERTSKITDNGITDDDIKIHNGDIEQMVEEKSLFLKH